MDALSTILRSVRLRSVILSRGELFAPFGISTTGTPGVALFHAVLEGRLILNRDGALSPVETGEVVVLTRGVAHAICDASSSPFVARSTLPFTEEGGVKVVRYGRSNGSQTRILCGQFHLDHAAASAFLTLLPEVLLADRTAVGSTLALIDAELGKLRAGSGAVLTSLCDVLFVEALRGCGRDAERGWLAALTDPAIGKALAMVHSEPGTTWDASSLGAKVGLSRTRFFDRFSKLVGEPPAKYLARWRMSVAAEELRSHDVGTAALAASVGYESEEAFSRVFKRHIGMSPRAYRRAMSTSS